MNAPDMRRQCANATDQWAQGVAGRPYFVAPHELASWARSVRGSNKESKAGSQWKPDSVATQSCG
jgi:hypothetical protein